MTDDDRALSEVVERDRRLRELADQIEPGEWAYHRGHDGALILTAGGEPIAHVYGGVDLAKYLVEVSPPRLLGYPA
jgi:hypothetical protein